MENRSKTMPDMNENAETQQEYFGKVRTDNTKTLYNALNKIAELEAQIENIRYYLDNEIPHDLINEATTKIWRMLK